MDNQIVSTITVKNVEFLDRGGAVGRVYRTVVSVLMLANLLRKAVVRYSPKYQRGFKKTQDDPQAYEVMLPISDPTLQIDRRRAEAMAVKLLQGELGNTEIVWNARLEDEGDEPVFDSMKKQLAIASSLTIPD